MGDGQLGLSQPGPRADELVPRLVVLRIDPYGSLVLIDGFPQLESRVAFEQVAVVEEVGGAGAVGGCALIQLPCFDEEGFVAGPLIPLEKVFLVHQCLQQSHSKLTVRWPSSSGCVAASAGQRISSRRRTSVR